MATSAIAGLAIAAPVTQSSADTQISVPLPPYIPAFVAPLLAGIGPASQVTLAHAGAAIGDVFNGGTTVVVSTGPATGSTNGAP